MTQERHDRRSEPSAHPGAQGHTDRYDQRLLQPHQRDKLACRESHRAHQGELKLAVAERDVRMNQETQAAQHQY